MSTVKHQLAQYRVDVREKALRIVEDVHRTQPLSARKREEAVLRVCEVLARQEHAMGAGS